MLMKLKPKKNDKKLSTTYTLFEGTKSGRITKALLENNSQRKDFYTFSFYKMLKNESTMSHEQSSAKEVSFERLYHRLRALLDSIIHRFEGKGHGKLTHYFLGIKY